MDEIDLKIILLLMNNSRLTYREISDYLGLSVNALYKRVQGFFVKTNISIFLFLFNNYLF